MTEGVKMEFNHALGGRIHWECPECGHKTTTAKKVIAYCTACEDDD